MSFHRSYTDMNSKYTDFHMRHGSTSAWTSLCVGRLLHLHLDILLCAQVPKDG